MQIEEILQAVQEAFQSYADDIQARPQANGSASYDDGQTEGYANCLAPLLRSLIEQWFRESYEFTPKWEGMVSAVMDRFEQLVTTSPIAFTSPWTPSELLAHQAFREAIAAKIKDEFAQELKRWVVLVQFPERSAFSKPPSERFADRPQIRKLVEEHPETFGQVNVIARLEEAEADAEVAFRQREKNENWADWAGPYPWDERADPDTTECPWWLAGAEYVFHLAGEWRKHSPFGPETIAKVLPKQITMFAEWVYWRKVLFNDLMHGLKSSAGAKKVLGGLVDQFSNVAFLFVMRRLADSDLEEWQNRAAGLSVARTNLENLSVSGSNEPAPRGPRPSALRKNDTTSTFEMQNVEEVRSQRKPTRRNTKYEVIDKALIEISGARPKNHEEVFRFLDERKVAVPKRKPFKTTRGWLSGFQHNPHTAGAWLSQAWGRLGLPAFARGPKK